VTRKGRFPPERSQGECPLPDDTNPPFFSSKEGLCLVEIPVTDPIHAASIVKVKVEKKNAKKRKTKKPGEVDPAEGMSQLFNN